MPHSQFLNFNFFNFFFFRLLEPGVPISEVVGNQDAQFYRFFMKEKFEKAGVVIRCKSSASSKFKLVLFDKEGLFFDFFMILKDCSKQMYLI